MSTSDHAALYERAWKGFPAAYNFDKAEEEASELIAEIVKRRHGRADARDVAREMADVHICIEVLRMGELGRLFGEELLAVRPTSTEEECSALISAIVKHRNGSVDARDVARAMAGVFVCIESVRCAEMIGRLFDDELAMRLDRLEARCISAEAGRSR